MNSNSDLTILVSSCDKYLDVLRIFSSLFRTYWPDCPFEVTLVTETAPAASNDLCFHRTFPCGFGGTWCEMLASALDKITTPYVLFLCDDYFLYEAVDTGRILKRLTQAQQYQVANLRLLPNPKPTLEFKPEEGLMEYAKDTGYCIATQAGIWDRLFLRDLARRCGKSAWEFERFGSFMCGAERRSLLCVTAKEFPFVDAIHKGYWEPFGVRVCQDNHVPIDFAKRGLPPLSRRLIEQGKSLLFHLIPTTWLVRFQNRFGFAKK